MSINYSRLSSRELYALLDTIDDKVVDNIRFIEAITNELKSRQY